MCIGTLRSRRPLEESSDGSTDAVIALGPMRSLFRKTMDKAFNYAARYDGHDVAGQEFVVVSESLGSFVVMDAAAKCEFAI